MDWDYTLNADVRPEHISPRSRGEYWYRCRNDWCNMPYKQSAVKRDRDNYRCFYCSGSRVCEWNCLATNYPELCLELDPSNSIKPTEVTPGSDVILTWICDKHGDIPVKWSASISRRALGGSGCSKCHLVGHDARVGGHDYFVKRATLLHNGKYQYPDKYRGSQTPINIYCPIIAKYGVTPHGNFLQIPNSHCRGSGCPKCEDEQTESKYVRHFQTLLESMQYKKDIDYFFEHTFPDLVYVSSLRVDRYLDRSGEQLGVEIDGECHFSDNRMGLDRFRKCQQRDIAKDLFFVKNGLNLLRIPYTTIPTSDYLQQIITLCLSGKQVYVTYKHYYDEVAKFIDMSKVHVIIVDCPKPP